MHNNVVLRRSSYLFWFVVIIVAKLIIMALFSSAYQNALFIPFVSHFLTHFDNPWQYFYMHPVGVEFPYHPLMLYIFALFYSPVVFVFNNASPLVIQNIFFKIPTLLADVTIFFLLVKIFPSRWKEVILLYFVSPIILYASYMHSQLDLIPSALLLLSMYCMTTRHIDRAALFLGCALATKLHVVAALPFVLIYIFKNYDIYRALRFICIVSVVYVFFTGPYLMSNGFIHLVLCNPKQTKIYEVFQNFGDLKVYISIVFLLFIYLKFVAYKKINDDLFFSFILLLFSGFLLLSVPSPGWYIWIVPFISFFGIKFYADDKKGLFLAFLLSGAYIVFFIFFYIPDHIDLFFLDKIINLKIANEQLRNISFSCLEALLLITLYLTYKKGILSNAIYTRNESMIIGISGDSGCGKTTLLSDIHAVLGEKMLFLEGDADHKWERGDENWNVFTHLDPKANHLHRQAENLLALKKGIEVVRSDYDHAQGVFTEAKKIKPKEFIVMSGLHTFYLPKMRKIIDVKIYMDTDEALRRHWKIVRDITNRNRSCNDVRAQIDERLQDAEKFIYPQKDFADVIIRYYSEDVCTIGDRTYTPHLCATVVFDSNIATDHLLSLFREVNVDVDWDYSTDLKTQYITIRKSILQPHDLHAIATRCIPNFEEFADTNVTWQKGMRGVVQLIVSMILSSVLQTSNNME